MNGQNEVNSPRRPLLGGETCAAMSGGRDEAQQSRPPACNFSEALEHIKAGRAMRREGWNGRNIFVYLNKGSHDFKDHESIPPCLAGIKRSLYEIGASGTVSRTPNLAIHAQSGFSTEGWVPSQTDMLAEDWVVT